VLDLLKPENTVLEELARSAPDQQEQTCGGYWAIFIQRR